MILHDLYYACGDMDCTHKAILTFGDRTTLEISVGEAVDRYVHLHVLCFTNKNEYWDIILKEDMNYL